MAPHQQAINQVPFSTYSDTYNKKPLMYLALASQKNHMALYLTRLKMGKSCLRFKKLEELPLDLLAEVVAQTSVEQRIALSEACRKK